MSWDYRIEAAAQDDLRALGPSAAVEVRRYLDQRIRSAVDPTAFGKPLRGDRKGFWRYRVRDWRILCRLEHRFLIVVVVQIGHRSTIYDG